jgi:hypothetical protein
LILTCAARAGWCYGFPTTTASRQRGAICGPSQPPALKILQLGAENAALARALKAAAEVELYVAGRVPSDVSTFDLVVTHAVEIAGHPATNMLWLGFAHETGLGRAVTYCRAGPLDDSLAER